MHAGTLTITFSLDAVFIFSTKSCNLMLYFSDNPEHRCRRTSRGFPCKIRQVAQCSMGCGTCTRMIIYHIVFRCGVVVSTRTHHTEKRGSSPQQGYEI